MTALKSSILFTCFVLLSILALGQSDSTIASTVVLEGKSDTSYTSLDDSSLMKVHSPGKAALFSAILPGAGQIYNKKYWKVPVIYAAGAGLAYLVVFNYGEYDRYRKSYISRIDSNSTHVDEFPFMSASGLQSEMERTQKNYELAAVGIALVYILQIVDATVDAHLKTFDVSDDLSMAIRPTILGTGFNYQTGLKPTFGVNLKLHFR